MKTIKRTTTKTTDNKAMRELQNAIAKAGEAAAMRLALEKIEKTAKEEAKALMDANGLVTYEFETELRGATANFSAEITCRSTTAIDTVKIAQKVDDATFRQIAKVSLVDARKFCGQSLIDECSSVVEGQPIISIKSKNVITELPL